MEAFKPPRSANFLIGNANDKLNQVEDHLRDIIVIGTHPEFGHFLFEAQAFIQQAVSALAKAVLSRE